MMRAQRFLAHFALLVSCGLGAGRARAEGAPPPVPALEDEESLVRFALLHNPELRAAHWDQALAEAGVDTAAALSNPIARVEWLHAQSPSNYGWGLGLEWTPPQPVVYGSRKDAARAQVRAVKEDFNERAADLEADVRRSCAQIRALGAELSLSDASLETRRALQQAVKERLARGAASRIDLSLVTVSLARGEQDRELLALSRESALTELGALLGLAGDRTLQLKPSGGGADLAFAGSQTAQARGDDQLVEQAVRARPVLQADAARVAASNELVSAEKAKRWPWLELVVRYRQHDQSTYPSDWTLGVDLTLPILSQNAGPIAAAEATGQQLRDVALAHRSSIEREVRVLRNESVHRAQIADHYLQQIAPVLAEHAALVKQALAGMELDLTSVLTAEDMVTRGGIEYEEARLAQQKAEIALARAVGRFGRVAAPKTK